MRLQTIEAYEVLEILNYRFRVNPVGHLGFIDVTLRVALPFMHVIVFRFG